MVLPNIFFFRNVFVDDGSTGSAAGGAVVHGGGGGGGLFSGVVVLHGGCCFLSFGFVGLPFRFSLFSTPSFGQLSMPWPVFSILFSILFSFLFSILSFLLFCGIASMPCCLCVVIAVVVVVAVRVGMTGEALHVGGRGR